MDEWTLLVYRIPANPSRLRLQVWRRLQKMGALYLQDAVCLLPARPDLVENMLYVAGLIEELGGTCHLFSARSLLPDGSERLVEQFRESAHARSAEFVERLERITCELQDAESADDLLRLEDESRKERLGVLRSQQIAYFGSPSDDMIDDKLEEIKRLLTDRRQGEWIDEVLHP